MRNEKLLTVGAGGDGSHNQNLPLGEGVTRSVTDEGFCGIFLKMTLIRLFAVHAAGIDVTRHPDFPIKTHSK